MPTTGFQVRKSRISGTEKWLINFKLQTSMCVNSMSISIAATVNGGKHMSTSIFLQLLHAANVNEWHISPAVDFAYSDMIRPSRHGNHAISS